MKSTRTFALLTLLLCTAAGMPAGTIFTQSKPRKATAESTSITIQGTSTLHDWTMKGATINGVVDVNPELSNELTAASWSKAGDPPGTTKVVIPVTSIRSENLKMDKLMLKALKSKTFPEIRYEMTRAVPAKPTSNYSVARTKGQLTIAGVTREVSMDVTSVRESDTRYLLSGESTIKMSDYGIKPPTAMMGTIRTGDVVKITFRWFVERAGNS